MELTREPGKNDYFENPESGGIAEVRFLNESPFESGDAWGHLLTAGDEKQLHQRYLSLVERSISQTWKIQAVAMYLRKYCEPQTADITGEDGRNGARVFFKDKRNGRTYPSSLSLRNGFDVFPDGTNGKDSPLSQEDYIKTYTDHLCDFANWPRNDGPSVEDLIDTGMIRPQDWMITSKTEKLPGGKVGLVYMDKNSIANCAMDFLRMPWKSFEKWSVSYFRPAGSPDKPASPAYYAKCLAKSEAEKEMMVYKAFLNGERYRIRVYSPDIQLVKPEQYEYSAEPDSIECCGAISSHLTSLRENCVYLGRFSSVTECIEYTRKDDREFQTPPDPVKTGPATKKREQQEFSPAL